MPEIEKVIEALVKARTAGENYKLQSAEMSFQFIEMLIKLLKEQPQIIRCKDCKYYHKPEYGFTLGDCTYGNVWFQAKEDGFCSDAKRKDN